MATEPQSWIDRMATRLRGVLVYLDENGGSANKHDVLRYVEGLLDLNDYERQVDSLGRPKWLRDTTWYTTNLVKPEWLRKDGAGTWMITDLGREALRTYPDPIAFHREAHRLYQVWKDGRPKTPQRRGWLVRGSSVSGLNLMPSWLGEGFVSLPAAFLGPLPTAPTIEGLRAQATADYAHLTTQEARAKADEIVALAVRMSPGDLVVASGGGEVFVGEVTGEIEQIESEGGRSNLRRSVDWRNADAPVPHGDLPSPLPAALQVGGDVVELTEHVALIDGLGVVLSGEESDGETPGGPARFSHLPLPSEGLAAALHVDHAWLADTAELLDERRQLIFYGPPGTGKTYIAQKLAADLVGPEQVRLVQFHPAYTYEDFFEGYRPMAGAGDGSIGFELRHGPLRRLVTQAREHPDQAFVLIIDEINRANLAKVFGELYFLLEYRDEAIELLYSPEEQGFTLPRNLFVIGTMNTADRSIALIDAAMRRRFAFVELSPDAEPTRSLLRRWSAHHGLGPTAADLLDALNRRIEDPDFRIGPSYFMTSTAGDAHSTERLKRIWRTALEPLLQEHHYGEWESVRARYRLEGLLAQIAPPSAVDERAEEASAQDPPAG